jgi:hypothetical protein
MAQVPPARGEQVQKWAIEELLLMLCIQVHHGCE